MKLRRWASFLLAAFVGLFGQRADATRTPIDTSLDALTSPLVETHAATAEQTEADGPILELVELYPLGQTDTGEHIELAVFVEPQTHTRVFYIVQSPLGLDPTAIGAAASGRPLCSGLIPEPEPIEPIVREGEDWRIVFLPSELRGGPFATRRTGGVAYVQPGGSSVMTPSAAACAAYGIQPANPKATYHPVEFVLGQHAVEGRGSQYTAVSSRAKGAKGIHGDLVWIDMGKVKANANRIWTRAEIVRASDGFLARNAHLKNRFAKWKSRQSGYEGELLIEGRIPASAVHTKGYIRLRTGLGAAGKVLFVYAAAMDTYSFFAAEKKDREAARIAGGWTGAWAFGKIGAHLGAKGGASLAAILGQTGPQVAAPEEIVTVPVFSLVGGFGGGLIFGTGGYWSGSNAGTAYYDFITSEMERIHP